MNVSWGYFWITLVVTIKAVQSTDCPHLNGFDCGNGRCISEIWRCDGVNDCGNLSDEHDCDMEENISRCSGFTCGSHQCIPQRWRCDGQRDCTDGSDEESCTLVSNPCLPSSCSHMCLISPVSGFRCVCPVGLKLAEDSHTCKKPLCGPFHEQLKEPGTVWNLLDNVLENSVGAKRQLNCTIGYEKVGGPDIVICQEDLTWTRTNVTCKEILCNPTFTPGDCAGSEWILVDDVGKNNSFGTKRQLKCSEGYERVGYPEIVECLLDGSWTRTNATCREDTLIKAGNVVLKSQTFIVITVVIVILVLIILALIGTTIYFVRKLRYQSSGKEMVAVYENLLTDGIGVSDADIASGHYETIHDNPTVKFIPEMPMDGCVLATQSKDGTSQKSPAMPADIV